MYSKVTFIEGMLAIDDRGELLFCNKCDMKSVRRFYLVLNHEAKFIRAWHAHKKEAKFVLVVSGVALVAAVRINNWGSPDKNAAVERYILSDKKPGVLFIPKGYAHGFMTLVSDTKLMFFSTSTLRQSREDDYRYDAYYWDPWEIAPR